MTLNPTLREPARFIDTDYLVIGAGGTGMAFVDTLLDDTDARILIVDRNEHAGGHWNNAYPFVRLHQPTAWYGVPSRAVPDDATAREPGDDRGATGAVVLSYFDQLMQDRFVASGRVLWMPSTEYRRDVHGTHLLRSLKTGEERVVRVRRRVVDSTLTRTEVPSTHPPKYRVADDVPCVPPNALPSLSQRYDRYTVIGGGKTGMDACQWLLEQSVPPAHIRWIVPRDSWLMNRAHMLPGPEHFAESIRGFCEYYGTLAEAVTIAEIFKRLEASNVLLRLDKSVQPERIRGAVSSVREMDMLRTITNVVRLGHVLSIEEERVVLERGEIDVLPNELFVDCSASAAMMPSNVPVFEGDTIRLLTLIWGQPLLSAALIAHVEATVADEAERNALCAPVLSPVHINDWVPMWRMTIGNAVRWRMNPEVHAWMRRSRLHVPTLLTRGVPADDPELQSMMKALGARVGAAAQRLAQNPVYG